MKNKLKTKFVEFNNCFFCNLKKGGINNMNSTKQRIKKIVDKTTTTTGVKIDEEGFYYQYNIRVTFSDTNAEGNVGHEIFALLMGKTRELFAFDCIPCFSEEIGREYLLKTLKAEFQFKKDFHFGDEIKIKMRVILVKNASFIIKAEFIDSVTGVIHAIGWHTIAYADIKGQPKRMPEKMRKLLNAILVAQE